MMCTLRVIAALSIVWLSQRAGVARAEDKIVVGVLAPLSGPAAELGTQIRNGLEIAKDRFTAPLELVFEDDACDPKIAVTGAIKLTTVHKATVVIGPLCSPSFLAVSPIFNRARVAFIHTSSGTLNTVARKGALGIEGTATVMNESERLVRHMRSLGHRTAAIIHFEQEWATGHANAFAEEFAKQGGAIVQRQAFVNVNETDFRSQLLSIRKSNVDAVFVAAFNNQTGVILRQLRELKVSVPVFSQYDVEDPAFLAAAQAAAEGVQYAYPFDNERLSPEAASFAKEYRTRYGVEPSFYPYNGFDIAMLVDAAGKKCGRDSTCIHRTISSVRNYVGLTGPISFSADGTIRRNFIIKRVSGGRFVSAAGRD